MLVVGLYPLKNRYRKVFYVKTFSSKKSLNEAMAIVYMAPIELKQIKLAFLLTVYATQIFVFLFFFWAV